MSIENDVKAAAANVVAAFGLKKRSRLFTIKINLYIC